MALIYVCNPMITCKYIFTVLLLSLAMTASMAEDSLASEYPRRMASNEKKRYESSHDISPIQTDGLHDTRSLYIPPSIAPSTTQMPTMKTLASPVNSIIIPPSASPSISHVPTVKPSAAPTNPKVPVTSPSPTASPSVSPTDMNNETSNEKKIDEEESLGIFFGLMCVVFVFLGYKAYQRRKRHLVLRDRMVVASDPNHVTNTHLSEFNVDDNELI